MPKYKVVNDFIDAYQAGTSYKKGDEYPKDGYEVSEERLKYLSSKIPAHDDKIFIEEVKETSKKSTASNKKTSSKAKDDE